LSQTAVLSESVNYKVTMTENYNSHQKLSPRTVLTDVHEKIQKKY